MSLGTGQLNVDLALSYNYMLARINLRPQTIFMDAVWLLTDDTCRFGYQEEWSVHNLKASCDEIGLCD